MKYINKVSFGAAPDDSFPFDLINGEKNTSKSGK